MVLTAAHAETGPGRWAPRPCQLRAPASLTVRREKGRPEAAFNTSSQPISVGIFSNSCVVYVIISCNIQLPENKIAAPTPAAFGRPFSRLTVSEAGARGWQGLGAQRPGPVSA